MREHLATDGSNTRDQHPRVRSSIGTSPDAEAWADAMMGKAEPDSDWVNSVLGVKRAVIGVHKARRGEPSPDWQPYRLRR